MHLPITVTSLAACMVFSDAMQAKVRELDSERKVEGLSDHLGFCHQLRANRFKVDHFFTILNVF